MFGYLAILFTFALLLVFAVQNAAVVSVSFLFWKFDASLSIIILFFFITGAFSAAIALWIKKMNKKPAEPKDKNTVIPEKTDNNNFN
ncbi:MAG: LapA family protein [Candidatus Goldbacteria bacterium]|nr:LapA family protein [Candidatus Goldiibacteriota bacterium]